MKIKKERIISLFLAVLMIVSIIPMGTISASAVYENTYKNTGNQRADIIGVAKTQIGYKEGSNNDTKYGTWYGLPNQPWCAMFVSWCARQAGVPTSVLKNSAVAAPDSQYFNIPYYNGASYTPKAGDLFFTKSWSHVGLVYYIDGNYFYTIEGNSNNTGSSEGTCVCSNRRKISDYYFGVPNYGGDGPHVCSFSGSYFESAHPHKVYQKCSCGKTQYTGATRAYQNCSTCMKLSIAYVMPIKAYTINTGKTTVYDAVNGTAKSNKIYDTDLCTISQIYDCGWCKVTFPLDAGGTETGYCKINVFMKSGGYIAYTSKQINTYIRSDLKTLTGYAGAGDKIYILGNSGSAVQIAYPLTAGGWKVGWVSISDIKCTIAYNANGGSGTMTSSSVQYNNTFTLSENKFTKTGYTFGGWNVYRSSDKKWYVSGEGWKTASEISSNSYTKNLYKNQYSGTLSKAWMNLGKTNDTFTFYAVWTPNKLTVNYNANGGTVSSDTYKLSNNIVYTKSTDEKLAQTWTYNSAKTNGLYNASTFGMTKVGYTFKGWGTTASGGTVFDQDDSTLVPTSINSAIKNGNCSSTLYAVWKANTYTVQYNANGGTGTTVSSSHTYDIAKALTANGFTRTGYTFLGWSTNASATSSTYSDKQSVKNLTAANGGTVTLYAVWQKNPVTVSFIDVQTLPTKITYTVGETFSSSGLSIKVDMSDGTSQTVTSGFTVSAPDMTTAGTKTVTVTYSGKTTSFTIRVNNPPATVSSITVQSKPSKTIFTVGETFSSSGLSIKVNMSDGTIKTVTSGFTVSAPDMTTAGTKTVTVTYQGKTTSFNITVNKPVNPTSAKYIVSGATATAGSTVEIYVSLENNPGIISLRNQITYDTSVMELVKVEDLKLLSGYTTPSPTVTSPYTLRWADSLATENNTANGNLVKLTFVIKDDAQTGEYNISVMHTEARTATGEKVEFAQGSAVITVIDYILGDADGNGEVDDWDAIILNRYLAGWQTEVNLAAADVDGDGELTDWDAIALERRLAGWEA